jgi:hypothetical protein
MMEHDSIIKIKEILAFTETWMRQGNYAKWNKPDTEINTM